MLLSHFHAKPTPLPTKLPPGVNIADAGSVDKLKTCLLQYYKIHKGLPQDDQVEPSGPTFMQLAADYFHYAV